MNGMLTDILTDEKQFRDNKYENLYTVKRRCRHIETRSSNVTIFSFLLERYMKYSVSIKS